MSTLIVTNGSAAVDAIARVRPDDRFLPWDDVLHDGPVPSELPLNHLSAIRARFVSECGSGPYDEIREHFNRRDHLLISARAEFDEIVLWFEHDLYDQLQLIQILAELGEQRAHSTSKARVTLICKDNFVSMSDAEILARDFRDREPVDQAHFELGLKAWSAFTHVTPLKLEQLVDRANLSVLPYLRASLNRWFEEYPDIADGLSRTEHAALDAVSGGITSAPALFRAVQDAEEAQFLGDASFWRIVERMNSKPDELLSTLNGERFSPHDPLGHSFKLTELAERVLDGTSRRVHTWREKWMGGVLLGPRNFWYWNPESESFEAGML